MGITNIRKIMSKEDLEAKRKRNSNIISIAMLAILVIGTAGYAYLSGEKSETGKSETSGEYFALNIGEETLYFKNSPENVSSVPVNINTKIEDYAGKPLYIASEDNEITREITSTLGRFAERVQLACYQNCTKDLPEKDCSVNLIVYNAGNESVRGEENCVFIEGDEKAVDAFVYKLLDVN